MGIPDHLTCLLRNLYAGKKQQLELDMEQQTSSKSGKEYIRLYGARGTLVIQPGIKPMSPAWQGRFLTREAPGVGIFDRKVQGGTNSSFW